jgi:hypothetical protein
MRAWHVLAALTQAVMRGLGHHLAVVLGELGRLPHEWLKEQLHPQLAAQQVREVAAVRLLVSQQQHPEVLQVAERMEVLRKVVKGREVHQSH